MAGRLTILLLVAVGTAGGCRTAPPTPDYVDVAHAMHHSRYSPESTQASVGPLFPTLAGPHPVEFYVGHALAQNPEIQAARSRIQAAAFQVPVAASLPDPMMKLTVQPSPVQTAAGQQELILSADQKVPWVGKLATQAGIAEAETNMARARLADVELDTIAKVKRAYYEIYYIQQALRVTSNEKQLLLDIRDVANTRYRTGSASQQDVLRAELEISAVENSLIQLRQQLASSQARLARLLHVSTQTDLQALDRLPAERIPENLDRLQEQAVQAHPQLHAQLAAIERGQLRADLARLDYKPDVTVGFSWIDVATAGISPVANGDDAFLLTAGVNLPIYKKRLDSAVRSAEAQAVVAAREYDSLRDEALEQVADLFAQARSQQSLLTLFRDDILPRARQTFEVSSRAYNVGEVDFLQLLDNWRQLMRYEINYHRLEASQRQTLAELERVVGGFGISDHAPLPAPVGPPARQPEELPRG